MANLILVHYLGVAALACTMNMRLMNRIFRDVAAGEESGQPCIISTAITEPGAGTDVEETDLVDRGRVSCHARRVDGGYVVNGTKVFISSGHLSTWHILIAYSDLEKPSRNTVVMAVRNSMKGFSFGKMEKKMGQKGCPASELVFDDCFVPDEFVCGSPDDIAFRKMDNKDVIQLLLDDVLSASRAGVGALGAGAARGAFETALDMAAKETINGRPLINYEWVQCLLAEMYKNTVSARLTYMESNYANGLYGAAADLQARPAYYYMKFTPRAWFDRVVSGWLDKPAATRLMRHLRFRKHDEEKALRVAGLGSLAKFFGTDMGIKNCHLALDLMGQAGLRHDRRAEKFLRDAKLLQIYEGTNQLNRLNVFKCLIGRNYPQVKIFDE
jgi:alkylation response protein AidB-like acyl-CoA dehydrogenase